jgi:hypothetical protein
MLVHEIRFSIDSPFSLMQQLTLVQKWEQQRYEAMQLYKKTRAAKVAGGGPENQIG